MNELIVFTNSYLTLISMLIDLAKIYMELYCNLTVKLGAEC